MQALVTLRALRRQAEALRVTVGSPAQVESVDGDTAVLRTPEGAATIRLAVDASARHGTVDWRMTFPEGSVATAFSRLVALGPSDCVFAFVLTPPPVPLESLEGALAEQSRTLARELKALKEILESDAG